MYYRTNDYIMRQIEMVSAMLLSLFFGEEIKYTDLLEEDESAGSYSYLYHKLKTLISEGNINEAENELFAAIDDAPTIELLALAIYFYSELQHLPDKSLEAADFSREEILQGLNEIYEIYLPVKSQIQK